VRSTWIPALVVVSALAAGCGGSGDDTPVACLEGARPYLNALADAPRDVLLRGETAISDCLAENQQGGDLATAGAAMIEAATRLNAEARQAPGSSAALRLGYLLGAANRGAEQTEGIHADLLRRLDAAVRYSPTGGRPASAAFQAAYERGYAAGRDHG